MQDDKVSVFYDVLQAQEFAKNNPGTVVTRTEDGKGFVVKNARANFHSKKTSSITPTAILEHLNKHVISQESAKYEISQALYYHYLTSLYPENKTLKNNGPLMIVGSTGSGKTFITQQACKFLDCIFLHVDSSSMVPDGIKGYSIDSLGKELLKLAKYDTQKAQRAVVFLDEIDKLFLDSEGSSYGAKVSAQLLRVIEGTQLKIYSNNDTTSNLDTSNIQFILSGAFQSIIDEKSIEKNSVGFKNSSSIKQNIDITLEDLYDYGVPKELLGRMSSIVNLCKLSEDDFYDILTKSKSSPLQEYIDKIEFHGCKVQISEETMRSISAKTASNNLGVRALKQILKKVFSDAMFTSPNGNFKTYTITDKEL